MPGDTTQTQGIAERLRTAFETRDLFALAEILDPDVRWGGPEDTPQTCHNREDVLAWYGGLYGRGFRAEVIGVTVEPDRIVLALDVIRPNGETTRNQQVFTVAGGLIVDIRDHIDGDAHEAHAEAGQN